MKDGEVLIHSDRKEFFDDSKTKEYKIQIPSKTELKKKIKYINPSDFNKKLQITTFGSLIKLRTSELLIDFKSINLI